MYAVEILEKEHRCILDFNRLIRFTCCTIMDTGEVNIGFMRECAAFGRNFADRHHHGKEEKILFRIMLDELGVIAEKVINGGMLIEHDLGRYHLSELERSLKEYEKNKDADTRLDIIMNASAYGSLLKRHIEKEDQVIFQFAQRSLDDSMKEKADKETEEFEKNSYSGSECEKYLDWLYSNLEKAGIPAERKKINY